MEFRVVGSAAVGGIMTYTLVTRQAQGLSVIHDRNPIFVRLSDGALRNAYTVRISNKRSDRREFALSLSGLPGSLLDVVQTRDDGRFVVEVGPDQTREVLRLFKPVDGIFFDMCWDQPSLNNHAVDAMLRDGFNPENEQDRAKYARLVKKAGIELQ